MWSSLVNVKIAVFGDPVMGWSDVSCLFCKDHLWGFARVSGFIVTLETRVSTNEGGHN